MIALEKKLAADPKELAVREVFKLRAAALAEKLKDPAAALAVDKAAAEKKVADLTAANGAAGFAAAEKALAALPKDAAAAKTGADTKSRALNGMLISVTHFRVGEVHPCVSRHQAQTRGIPMLQLTFPRNFRSVLVGSLLAMAALASSAQTMDMPPTLDVGDRWTYRFHNVGDKRDPFTYTHEVKAVDGTSAWMLSETHLPNLPPKIVWRYDLRRADTLERFEFDAGAPNGAGRRTLDLQNNDDFYQFPLAVGKKFNVKEIWIGGNDGSGHNEFKAEVQAYERVKVEAGEFDAFRIKYSGWWTRTSGPGTGRAELLRWYAPEAKRVVKSETNFRTPSNPGGNHFTVELVKWEPAPKPKSP